MRIPSLVPAVLLAVAAASAPAAGGIQLTLREAVWRAVDASAEDFPKQVESLEKVFRATPGAVEEALRAGRPDYPKEAPKGKLVHVKGEFGPMKASVELTAETLVKCGHVDHENPYFLYVPTTYDAAKAHPLGVIFMGGSWDRPIDFARTVAISYIAPWIGLAEKEGVLLVAPASDRGWGNIGRSLTRAAVADVERKYNVDPDRRFCWGQSMGGHAAWREGLFQADRWALVSPVCGGDAGYVDRLDRFRNVALYQVWGKNDPHPAKLNASNALVAEAVAKAGLNAVCAGREGGHELFPDEFPKIVDFLAKSPRNLYPRTVWGVAAAPGPMGDEPGFKWSGKHTWTRPIDQGWWYWTHLTKGKGSWKAEVKEGNRIEIETKPAADGKIEELELWLHDRLVDLDKPVTVVLDGKTVFEGRVERSIGAMLEAVRETGDRGRIYQAKVALKR